MQPPLVRSKVDATRLKASPIPPYRLTLTANGMTYAATVAFRGAGQQMTLAAVETVALQGL